MYKLIGLTVFLSLLLWGIVSIDNDLDKKIISLENKITELEEDLNTTKCALKSEKTITSYLTIENNTYNDALQEVMSELEVCNSKEPITKVKTVYKTNPLYVKCTK
jgi:hypothetical protein